MSSPLTPSMKVFYSYAHEDEDLRNKLEQHLCSLRRQGVITEWYDRQLHAGVDWASAIDTHLNTASVILLLISPAFMASDYCYTIEMKRALERHATKDAPVIPIILHPVDWLETPFAKLQVLPTDAKPVTTWRNRDEAFLDVARGIRASIEEWRSSASTQPTSCPLWNVPYRRNLYFTGQGTILSHLYNQLGVNSVEGLKPSLAITGLGGVGKTQIAVEYVYRYRDEYQAVLWVRAASRESLTLDFVALAHVLGLPEKDVQDRSLVITAVKHWLDTHAQWLLIFDNVENIALVSDFLPPVGKGHILFTTRSQAQGTTAQSIEVEPMSPAEGSLLLLRRAKKLALKSSLDQCAPVDHTAAEKLVQALGGLPLALDQAGAYIEETGCGVSDYLKRYRIQHTKLLKRRGTLANDHIEPVATTWSLSFQKVEQRNLAAAELLQLCAFLHPDAIPEELISEGASHLGPFLQALAGDLIAIDEAMEVLRSYSLVRRNADTKMLSIHRLIQTVLKDEMDEHLQRQWAERIVQGFNTILPHPDVRLWDRYQRCLLQIRQCAALIDQWSVKRAEAAQLLDRAGMYLFEQAQYEDAESFLLRAVTTYEQIFGPEHPEVAMSLADLAQVYEAQEKLAEAEALLLRAQTIDQQTQEGANLLTATILNNLGRVWRQQQNRWMEDVQVEEALKIRERILGVEHADTAISLHDLGAYYVTQQRYPRAELLFRQALIIQEKVLGSEHPRLSLTLHNLAYVYRQRYRYTEAEPLYQRALAIREKFLGPEHPLTVLTRNSLVALHREQEENAQGETGFQKLLVESRELALPLITVMCLKQLAWRYYSRGEYVQAEPLFKEALTILEQSGREYEYPGVVGSLNSLAELYIAQGKYEDAERLLLRRSCRATPPPMKKSRIGGDVPTQRSLGSCAEEPDPKTDRGGRRNHRLLRWGEDAFRKPHVEEKLRFCPSKPEHPLRKSTGGLRWRFSTRIAPDWTSTRRQSRLAC